MPVYDCRKDNPEPGSIRFPCNVRVLDPADGRRIENVFYLSTGPARVGRFVVGADGEPLVSPERKRRLVDNGRGGKKLEIYYDRLEQWTFQPWVAVAVDTGEVVAKSEGV